MHFENTDLICLVVIAIKITNIITKKLKCSSYAWNLDRQNKSQVIWQ